MAAKVGTGVQGNGSAQSGTIASAAKSTTTGNLLVAYVKWENLNTVSSLADTAGNTWQIAEQGFYGTDEPRGALCYAENITGHATNVVTATFSGATATWRVIIVEEFSGIATSSSLDGAATENSGDGTTYTTGNIITTTSGLVFMGVSGYTALSSHSGVQGNPDFTIGLTQSDTFVAYLISASAQTVSPGATASPTNRWYAASQAFKDAAGGGGAALSIAPIVQNYRNMRIM